MIRRNILSDQATADAFVEGVLRLKDPAVAPWPGQAGLSLYDFFIFWHHRAMMLLTPPTQNTRNAAHSGPVFLPWHRYMLLMFEFQLRDVLADDDFRVPYWDWAGDADLPNPAASPLWQNTLLGRFEQADFRVRLAPNPFDVNPSSVDRTLDRNVGADGPLSTRGELRALVRDQAAYDVSPYSVTVGGFRNRLEGWVGPGHHNAAHRFVGGDMQLSTSPNDPAFYLVHCNVDRVWTVWRQEHPTAPYMPPQTASADLLFHRPDDAMHTFFNHGFDITPAMMLDASPYYTYDTLADLT